jgi:hypothetical protein
VSVTEQQLEVLLQDHQAGMQVTSLHAYIVECRTNLWGKDLIHCRIEINFIVLEIKLKFRREQASGTQYLSAQVVVFLLPDIVSSPGDLEKGTQSKIIHKMHHAQHVPNRPESRTPTCHIGGSSSRPVCTLETPRQSQPIHFLDCPMHPVLPHLG